MMKKVVGYARVSTELQREKQTIKTQEELICQFCEEQGYNLLRTYCEDGVSGTVPMEDRPQGKRLLEAAKQQEFEAVVVYKSDRLGRSPLVNETVAKNLHDDLGIQLIGIAENIDLTTNIGRMMFTLNSALARMERENTLQRSRDATIQLAKDGIWLGGIVPFGYRIDGRDREARLRVSDELIPGIEKSEADIVRMIYMMSAEEGLSCIQISDRLNVLGIPTSYIRDGREVAKNKRKQKTRGVWRPGRVRNMIVETTYKGLHQWGKRGSKNRPNDKPREIIERAVPNVVDESTWQRAQETLRKNRMLRPDVEKRHYLLRGLMKCSMCGLTYVGTAHKGRSVTKLNPAELLTSEIRNGRALKPYYCNGKNKQNRVFQDEHKICSSISLNAHEIENLIWNDLENFMRNPGDIIQQLREVLECKLADTEGLSHAMARISLATNSTEIERQNVYRLHRRGQMSDASLDFQLKEIEGEETLLKSELHRIRGELLNAQNANELLLSAENTLLKLQMSLETEIPWETRRKVVEALVDSIEVETVPTEKGKMPRVRVKYRFEMPDGVSKSAQVNIGTHVPAGVCWRIRREYRM